MTAINQSEVRKSSDSSATFTVESVESRMKELNLEERLESLRGTQPNLAFEIENTPRPSSSRSSVSSKSSKASKSSKSSKSSKTSVCEKSSAHEVLELTAEVSN